MISHHGTTICLAALLTATLVSWSWTYRQYTLYVIRPEGAPLSVATVVDADVTWRDLGVPVLRRVVDLTVGRAHQGVSREA